MQCFTFLAENGKKVREYYVQQLKFSNSLHMFQAACSISFVLCSSFLLNGLFCLKLK